VLGYLDARYDPPKWLLWDTLSAHVSGRSGRFTANDLESVLGRKQTLADPPKSYLLLL